MARRTDVDLTADLLLDDLTSPERDRAARVESVLPALSDAAVEADRTATFPPGHVGALSDAGLLGLVVPESHGGLGGGLRDLTAATFAMGTVCPSTALAFFFHCSGASRGLLPLEAIAAGLFTDEEAPIVEAFAHKVLGAMGRDGKWVANFASESAKNAAANITISTAATATEGGWLLNGIKAFGCATGVADYYLVTAKIEGTETAEHLCVFLVERDADGVTERSPWDGIGMRATANHGIVLKDVFVAADDALTVAGAFVRMMEVSRGSFVGAQLAGTAVYLGAAQASYDFALDYLLQKKFEDTGEPLAMSPMHQEIIGHMSVDLETSYLWMRRQLQLEASDPPIKGKPEVIRQWRMSKGAVAETAFAVGTNAVKACGTSNTANTGLLARMLRDLTMGLVQAFPAEKGRLEAAKMTVTGSESTQFAAAKK